MFIILSNAIIYVVKNKLEFFLEDIKSICPGDLLLIGIILLVFCSYLLKVKR